MSREAGSASNVEAVSVVHEKLLHLAQMYQGGIGSAHAIDVVLTDTQERYQLYITRERCEVLDSDFRVPQMSGEMSSETFLRIASRELSAQRALLTRKVRINGDLKQVAVLAKLFSE